MTKGKKAPLFLKKYAQTTMTLFWGHKLERKVALRNGFKSPSLRQMAMRFPVGCDRKLLMLGRRDDVTYDSSKVYWSRILSGVRCIRNNPCTAHVENNYPQLHYLRTHPVWVLLGNPTLSINDIYKMLIKMESALNGKLIHIKTSKLNIIFKHRPWSSDNVELVDSLDGFALRLALFRLSKLQPLNNAKLYSPKTLALHLLRLVTQKKWSRHGDRLIRLLLVFIEVNEKGISDETIEKILRNDSEDIAFQKLFLWISPQEGRSQFHSLSDYIQANRNLAQSFWQERVPDALQDPVSWRVTMETLFWADTYSDLWLHKGIPKEKLFCPGSPVFADQLENFSNGSRRRIW